MSVRIPENLVHIANPTSGLDILQAEILAEQASTLGSMGREVEAKLAAWREAREVGVNDDSEALDAAAQAVWHYFVQREMCGMHDHSAAIETYGIPGIVLSRLGAKPHHSDKAA